MKFTKKIREEYTEIIEFMESANVTINNDDSEIFEAWLQEEYGITIAMLDFHIVDKPLSMNIILKSLKKHIRLSNM